MNRVICGDALTALKTLDDGSVDMVYTDPPFNTGVVRVSLRTGDAYDDWHTGYIAWVNEWVTECHRVLNVNGTMYLHLDDRNAYRVRLQVMDKVFGEQNYLSTVIWSYNFGGRGKDRWPAKHDTILVYAKSAGQHVFNYDDVERIPYAAPSLQYIGRSREEAEKRIAQGQVPTDVWNIPIVGTNSKERVGYPTQKPIRLVKRAIGASCAHGGIVLDPFGGSGTTALAAVALDRRFIVIDENQQAIEATKRRLTQHPGVIVEWT